MMAMLIDVMIPEESEEWESILQVTIEGPSSKEYNLQFKQISRKRKKRLNGM